MMSSGEESPLLGDNFQGLWRLTTVCHDVAGCDLDPRARAWHLYPMQLFRTMAVIALVLLMLPWGASASIKAPPVAGTQELAARQALAGPSRAGPHVKVALIPAPAEAECPTALPGTPCHPEYLLPAASEPCDRDPAREGRCIDRSHAGAGQSPSPIYRPPWSC
mgnify:CR=1 FL=1